MAECRYCAATNVRWGSTKDGRPILIEIREVPHFILCKKAPRPSKRKEQARIEFGRAVEGGATEAERKALLDAIAKAEQS